MKLAAHCAFCAHGIYATGRTDCGPTFGCGSDIHICNNSNTTQSSYSNFYYSYKYDQLNLTFNTEEAKSFLAGSFKFLTTEIEVFQKIKFKKQFKKLKFCNKIIIFLIKKN